MAARAHVKKDILAAQLSFLTILSALGIGMTILTVLVFLLWYCKRYQNENIINKRKVFLDFFF